MKSSVESESTGPSTGATPIAASAAAGSAAAPAARPRARPRADDAGLHVDPPVALLLRPTPPRTATAPPSAARVRLPAAAARVAHALLPVAAAQRAARTRTLLPLDGAAGAGIINDDTDALCSAPVGWRRPPPRRPCGACCRGPGAPGGNPGP